LNAIALTAEVSSPSPRPPKAETSNTAGRYTTLNDTTGAICFSG